MTTNMYTYTHTHAYKYIYIYTQYIPTHGYMERERYQYVQRSMKRHYAHYWAKGSGCSQAESLIVSDVRGASQNSCSCQMTNKGAGGL